MISVPTLTLVRFVLEMLGDSKTFATKTVTILQPRPIHTKSSTQLPHQSSLIESVLSVLSKTVTNALLQPTNVPDVKEISSFTETSVL